MYTDAVKVHICQQSFKSFQNGNCDVTDQPRSQRRSTMHKELLKKTIELDPRQSTRYLELKPLYCLSVQRNPKRIEKTCSEGIWAHHKFLLYNRPQRFTIVYSLLTRNTSLLLLNRIVKKDEKWLLNVNRKRKIHWLSRNESSMTTPKPRLQPHKPSLCVSWNTKGVIHSDLLEYGEDIVAKCLWRAPWSNKQNIMSKASCFGKQKSAVHGNVLYNRIAKSIIDWQCSIKTKL